MYFHISKILWVVASVTVTALAIESSKPDLVATSPSAIVSTVSALPTGPIPTGPEARQAPSSPVSPGGGSPVYPYNLNSLYASSGYEPSPGPSSGGPSGGSSLMSFLRSPQGGRRNSLTSRLRNLMNSIFFRETGSPYMASGSSYSYAFRQPPPFGFSSLAGSSGLPSGYGSSPNFLTAASGYRPVVFPNYPGSGSGSGPSGPSGPSSWSNYKQWSGPGGPSGLSSGSPSGSSSLTSSLGSPGGTNYAWSSGSGSGPSGSSPYSSGLVSSYNSPSGASPSSSSYGSSSGSIPYQASASNTYPSSAPASYGSGSPSSYSASQGSPYQRSSNSNFKPVPSSGAIVDTSSSVSSSSSSSTSRASNTYKN